MFENNSFDVLYKEQPYDIQKFLKNHPGGINYIASYKEKDVAKRMEDTNHSKAAYYLFQEYKKTDKEKRDASEDEDLERLVEWHKPMLNQVCNLGTHYKEWVISPVDRHLRLFGNPILESLTITPWYIVPLIWIPVIIYLIKYGSESHTGLTKDSSPIETIVFTIILGIFLWTVMEYSLHRWVFHIEPSGNSKILIYLHFILHGLHHKVPFDTRRLVFPPFPAAIIALILYKIFCFVIPESRATLLLSGVGLGYVSYDMIHFYLHYGAPKENGYFYYLKRYHNQHHFAHPDSGFGISNVIWDKVFGTTIKLKKLNMSINW